MTEQTHMIALPFTAESFADGAVLPEPMLCLGDCRWANYHVAAEIEFASDAADNYAGVGLRGADGFLLRVYASGRFELRYREEVLQSGDVPAFSEKKRHTVGIAALGRMLLCFVDGNTVAEMQYDGAMVRSGEMVLESAGEPNEFFNVNAKSMPAFPGSAAGCCVIGADAPQITHTEEPETWEIRFYGGGISLLGTAEDASIAVWLDGRLYSETIPVGNSRTREAFFTIEPIAARWHTLRMELLSGSIDLEGFEVPTDDPLAAYDPTQFPLDPHDPETPEKRKAAAKAAVKENALPIAGAAAAGVAVAAVTAGLLLGGKKRPKK
ncbi:MAG: hypothetical protein J5851_04395 [Oscillospiraceae bacterium]|nr:hypothetical protein [Oscillospiraceae bacterium]